MCSFSSDSLDVLKLHALSHQSEAAKILEELPQSLKEVCFGSKEQFKTELNVFLSKSRLKAQVNEFILKCLNVCSRMTIVECPDCGKNMKRKNLKRHIEEERIRRKRPLGQCKECGKNLLQDSIKRHMRTVHKETKEYEDKKMLDLF